MKTQLMKKLFFGFLVLGFLTIGFAQDRVYNVTIMYEADDNGKVLKQNPYNGTVILKGNGTYNVQLNYKDEGNYRFSKANASQPNDMILFYSTKGYQYFAYPKGNMLAIWLNKPRQGVNLWVNAFISNQPAQAPPASTSPLDSVLPSGPGLYRQGLIKNGRFAKTTMFTTTSAPSYFYYDSATGDFSHDQTGVVFRANGTYSLRANFGSTVTNEKGTYFINGKNVALRFSDHSTMNLTIADNGRDLHWYSNGMLISEFFFLRAQ